MSRFLLSPGAGDDLIEIRAYLNGIPYAPAMRIGRTLQIALDILATHPLHGHTHQELSELAGENVRSFVVLDYKIFYATQRRPILFLGIIHGKRDVETIMRQRLS